MRLTSNKAFDLILSGQAPDHLVVEGDLDFTHCSQPIVLPKGLFVGGSLTLTGANVTELPDNLDVMFHVHANRCLELARIGRGVKASSLDLSDSRTLRAIAHPVRVKHDLVLERCTALERLTLTGRVGYLRLSGCSRLAEIRVTLRADTVDVRGCSALRALATDKVRTVIVDEQTAMPYDYREHQVHRETALHWIAIGRARDGLRVSESIELGKHVRSRRCPIR